jgi:hypothetical protein
MMSDSNVHVGWYRKPCRFELPRAGPGVEPISAATPTQGCVLQGVCQYTCQATATAMASQPSNRNRWRQNCQTKAT